MRKPLAPAALAALLAILPLSGASEPTTPGEEEFREALRLERGNDTVAPDPEGAVRMLRNAAEKGYAPAMNYLGYHHFAGGGLFPTANEDSALLWLGKALDEGEPRAASNLGYILLMKGDSASDTLAATYLRKGADAGVPQAQAMLADLLATGRGVAKDTLTAISLYRDAARHGIPQAEQSLAETALPVWIKLPADSAFRIARNLFDSGLPHAALALADTLSAAGKLPTDEAELHLLRGDAFASGRGLPYDYRAANEEYYRAAMLGNRRACLILAETLEIFPDALRHLNAALTPQLLRQMASPAN